MKFLKFILSIPYAGLAGWLHWLLFKWIIPIAMGTSWTWFFIFFTIVGTIVSACFHSITTLLAFPSCLLCKNNLAAKIVQIPIYGFFGYSSLAFLWSVTPQGLLQWLVALCLTPIILITYIALIAAPFISTDDDD